MKGNGTPDTVSSEKKPAAGSPKPLGPDDLKFILVKRFNSKIEETQVVNGELAIWVSAANLLEVCRFLRESDLAFDHPRCLCGVDREEHLEVVYHLCSTTRSHKITIKVKLSRTAPKVPSLYPVYKGADWHERETAEMFGIVFEGHPDPRHLLLLEDFQGYPLRKDFSCPDQS
ncbi:MAG: NADH-quinone oxidoreductase subunit C [bacterium]